jgi:hypothetical protein
MQERAPHTAVVCSFAGHELIECILRAIASLYLWQAAKTIQLLNVRYWPLADIPFARTDVRS